MVTKLRATIEDLYHIPEDGKAELIEGEIVHMSPTGARPNRAAGSIYISLRAHESTSNSGLSYTDNAAYIVNARGRRSFSPDVSWYSGPDTDLKFLEGPPDFAVEVRSEGDYGPRAEREMAAKRDDYFAAGTLVVWDVDLKSIDVVRMYRPNDAKPALFQRGKVANAEPAVPGWSMPVDDLFK